MIRMRKDNSSVFNINDFKLPDVSYAPVYVWVWNDVCNHEIIDAQLAEMKNLGIRAFYILPEPKAFRPDSMPTNLEPDYLTEEYFELCAYAIKKGKRLGMECWIYDEGGWPSGSACGKVLQDHPEYAQQSLAAYEKTFSVGSVYKKSRHDVLAAFINDKDVIKENYVFSADSVVTEYVAEKGDGRCPDLLNKAATEYFIKITHEKYAEALKNNLSEAVSAVFTDEPKAPLVPFNDELAKKYEIEYGESILPYLPLIAKRVSPTEENVYILYRWYDLCSKMFCENFLLPCKKWANENGVAFTGHLDKDHNPCGCMDGGGNFNMMRALRCFDVPGIDVIWRQIYPESKNIRKDEFNCYNGFFPRYASSAAAQIGAKRAMSEIFGVAGVGLTYGIMRYTVGYQAVRGINIFNPFNFPLGRKGQLLAQELPVFTENQPFCSYLGQFNRYVERLSYIASLGERVCETALYYPVSDFQGGLNASVAEKNFDDMGRALEDMIVDFDIIDDDVLCSAEITFEGSMNIGRASYKTIIIPRGTHIPAVTQNALERFVENGGRVTYNLSDLKSVIHVEGKGVRAMHRKTDNADIFCLFKETDGTEKYKVHLPSNKGFWLDLDKGELQVAKIENGVLEITLAEGETAVILLTDEQFESNNSKEFKTKIEIPDDFTFTKGTELICTENGFESLKHSGKKVSVKMGDWSYLIGSAYSGSGVYETAFSLSDEEAGKEGKIDLGDVHFVASVYLNERYLGSSAAYPYILGIPEGILKKDNTLKVVVTNTSANWYVHTDYFNKWQTEELSPYFEGEKDFGKDYVSGGLYGPVVIFTE